MPLGLKKETNGQRRIGQSRMLSPAASTLDLVVSEKENEAVQCVLMIVSRSIVLAVMGYPHDIIMLLSEYMSDVKPERCQSR
jgi:hypothetical protein